MLVRSGNLNEGVAVSVTTMSGTAIGMAEWDIYLYLVSVIIHVKHFVQS